MSVCGPLSSQYKGKKKKKEQHHEVFWETFISP